MGAGCSDVNESNDQSIHKPVKPEQEEHDKLNHKSGKKSINNQSTSNSFEDMEEWPGTINT